MDRQIRILSEYRSSLKVIHAEEIVDLVFFRPMAFVVAKVFSWTSLTPNQVSVGSLIVGISVGVMIGVGTPAAMLFATLFLYCSTLLDCVDGQLARMRKISSPLGRILDGSVDYISAIAIFLGIGFWGLNVQSNAITWWSIVIVAGISHGIQAALYDMLRSEYINSSLEQKDSPRDELFHFQRQFSRLHEQGESGTKKILVGLYIEYLRLQIEVRRILDVIGVQGGMRIGKDDFLIRMWGFNGTSTHTLVLIVLCLMNRLDFYIYYLIFIGNMFVALMLLLQRISSSSRPIIRRIL